MKILGFILLLAAVPAAHAAGCRHSKTLSETIAASDISDVVVSAQAGSLEVRAHDRDTVEITGRACSDEARWLTGMTLEVGREADSLIIDAIIPNQRDYRPRYAYIDVTVLMPASIAAAINDTSGNLEVTDIRLASVNDSSGNLTLRNITGSFTLTDSSGEIEISDVAGSIEIRDSSGSMEINGVDGTLHIRHDSSGDIDIDGVREDVIIDSDGSGSIRISQVEQDVTIGNDGSGNITIERVGGRVAIGNDGSGNVEVRHVAGDFSIESKGSGRVITKQVAGSVQGADS